MIDQLTKQQAQIIASEQKTDFSGMSYPQKERYVAALALTQQYEPMLRAFDLLQGQSTAAVVELIVDDALAPFIRRAEKMLAEEPDTLPFYLAKPYVEALLRAEEYTLATQRLSWLLKNDGPHLHVIAHGLAGNIDTATHCAQQMIYSNTCAEHELIEQHAEFVEQVNDPRLRYFTHSAHFSGRSASFDERKMVNGEFGHYLSRYLQNPRSQRHDLLALKEARRNVPQQGDRSLFEGQAVIYGDYHVAGNFHVPHLIMVLGDLTVEGCLTVSGFLSVSGNISASAVYCDDFINAAQIEARDFVAIDVHQSASEVNYVTQIATSVLSAPLLLIDGKVTEAIGEKQAEHILYTRLGESPPPAMRALLKPACFRYCDGSRWDFSPMEAMARQGISVFADHDEPLHNHTHRVLPDPQSEPLTTWRHDGRFLTLDIIDHAASLTHLDLSERSCGYIPPCVAELSSLETLDVSHCDLKVIPAFVWTLPKLTKLVLTGNKTVLSHASNAQINALLKLFSQEKIAADERLLLVKLLENRPIDDVSQLSDELLWLAYRSGISPLFDAVLQHWVEGNIAIPSGSVVCLLGKPTTKVADLTTQLADKGVTLVPNAITAETTHVLLAAKPTKTALKKCTLEKVRALTLVSEVQCLAISQPDAVADTNALPEMDLPDLSGDFFTRHVFVVVGVFHNTAQNKLIPQYKALGATVRKKLSRNTDILIAGAVTNTEQTAAREMGIEIWDEAKALAVLKAAPSVEEAVVDNYLSDPLQPVVQLGPFGEVNKLAEQVVARFKGRRIMPDTQAYSVEGGTLENLLAMKDVEKLRGLKIEYSEEDTDQLLIAGASRLPQLSCLAITHGSTEPLSLAKVLDALPSLHTVWLGQGISFTLDIVRHSTLQQLILRTDDSSFDDFSLCSFPKLSYLEIGHKTPEKVLNQCFAQQQLPNLKHLGFVGQANIAEILRALDLPVLDSLALQVDEVNDEVIGALLELPICKQLKALHIDCPLLTMPERLSHESFPALEVLGVHYDRWGVCNIPQWLAGTQFTNGIHYDLQRANFFTDDARALLSVLGDCNALSVNLNNNHILSKAVQGQLQDYEPVPISVWNQQN